MSHPTKDTLHLLDVILERLRSALLSSLNLGVELAPAPKINKYDLVKVIDKELKPGLDAVAGALAIAMAAGNADEVVEQMIYDNGHGTILYYFEDEDGEVRMADFFNDIETASRPLPPGPSKIVMQPPEDVDIPIPLAPFDKGPIM